MSLSPDLFSYVVTWTYFAVYVTMFLFVSIICAIKVQTDYKHYRTIQQSNQQIQTNQSTLTKLNLVEQWAKLLWKKKKVYFQLLPHLFDQATDFGVLVEYWSLRNKDIG
eukprot:315599_1